MHVQRQLFLLGKECPRSGPGICILSLCSDVVRKGESGVTLCLWGDFHMARPWLILSTPNLMAKNDSLFPHGVSKGVFLPSHPPGDSLSPNLTANNSW